MITIEKLKIFDIYKGDIDGFARVGRDHEKQLFDNNEWFLIDSFYQDLDLINKRLVAQEYSNNMFLKLKENCDSKSFEAITSKIKFYKDFQKLAEILKHIKSFINSETDVVWSRYNNTAEFLADLNQDIEDLKNCNFTTLDKVQVKFLPTASYQEISISNGWIETYIKLSIEFDNLFKRLSENKNST